RDTRNAAPPRPSPRELRTSRRCVAGPDARRIHEAPRRRRGHACPAGAAFLRARRRARRTRRAAESFGRRRLHRHLGHREQLEDLLPLVDRRARADELEHLLATLHLADEDRADELVPEEEETLVVPRVVVD